MTRSLAAELRQLTAEVIRMGGLAEAQVVDAVDAVVRRDVPLAQALIIRDLRLDSMQSDVERRALALIGRHHPAEADLRRAISTLKLAMNLERCGDLARNIAKRSLVLSSGEPLRCELAPVRQITDVVIDSSSFNKARGDSYQLALTMKSTATIPLAMPAVELTLTDAQDQPVLRRVLLPTDMAAPAELPAKGEWGTSVSVLVTTGGARVAGYRLLAFYP
eukprot:gene9600-12949_t